jgi:hypothetical protein
MALDFLLGREIPMRPRSMFPNIDVRRPSLSEVALPTDVLKLVLRGVNAGASGLNEGPDVEKLNSLWPGVNAGAATLILPFELDIEFPLKWLDDADTGTCGANAE